MRPAFCDAAIEAFVLTWKSEAGGGGCAWLIAAVLVRAMKAPWTSRVDAFMVEILEAFVRLVRSLTKLCFEPPERCKEW
ncbi:hypothetical protein BTHE68_15140 [Burkholderia sp. THE68]|nr:hypothetical protein BTHE68_15140 [Burkholderia sp. THE68]BCQ23567.1 hypothetical protein NK8_16980 [Caballeronia sp. NK8]